MDQPITDPWEQPDWKKKVRSILADFNRRSILTTIWKGPATPTQLSMIMQKRKHTIEWHLNILKMSGFIRKAEMLPKSKYQMYECTTEGAKALYYLGMPYKE